MILVFALDGVREHQKLHTNTHTVHIYTHTCAHIVKAWQTPTE